MHYFLKCVMLRHLHDVGDWHPDVLMHPMIKQLDTLNGRHASLDSCQITN